MTAEIGDAAWPRAVELLPDLVVQSLVDGQLAEARGATCTFAAEWTALEGRLLALGVGYLCVLSETFPAGALAAATSWVNPGMAAQLDQVPELVEQDRAAALHDALGSIRGHDVTSPPTRGERPHSCSAAADELLALIDANSTVEAQQAARRMRSEWADCQDRMVHLCAALSTYVADTYDEPTMDALHRAVSASAVDAIDAIVDPTRRETPDLGRQVLSLLRAHSMTGVVSTDADELVIDLDCSSGLRMWRRGVDRFGFTKTAGPWSLGRPAGLPYYCSRCTTGVMRSPATTGSSPLWTIEPPRSVEQTCQWRVPVGPSIVERRAETPPEALS